MNKKYVEVIKEELIESNNWVDYYLVELKLKGAYVEKHNVIKYKNDSVVTVIERGDKILLLEQYRFIVDKMLIESPCGALDDGEDVIAAAKRETYEETGIDICDEAYQGYFYASNGITNQKIHVVFSKYSSGELEAVDNEVEKLYWMDKSIVFEKVINNEIKDGPSLLALQRYFLINK